MPRRESRNELEHADAVRLLSVDDAGAPSPDRSAMVMKIGDRGLRNARDRRWPRSIRPGQMAEWRDGETAEARARRSRVSKEAELEECWRQRQAVPATVEQQ